MHTLCLAENSSISLLNLSWLSYTGKGESILCA
ncbi:Uncharacterised protein [Segatella copri]|nr:Uncharacterised protein [Segatella copri]